MKVDQLIVVLSAQSNVLDGVGATVAAGSLRSLAQALEPAKAAQVKATCEKVSKAAKAGTPRVSAADGLLVESALDQLRLLLGLLKASSAKSAGDAALLLGVLEPIARFPIQSISAMLKAEPTKSGAATTRQPAIELDANVIRQIADRLATANGDDQKFKSLLGELKAQNLSKPAVSAVANRFLGVEAHRTYKTAKLAFQRIEERHFQDAISASRERAINQINH